MAASMIHAKRSNSWPMGVPPDRSRKHESTKARRNQEPGLYLVLAVRGQRQTPLFGSSPRPPRRLGPRRCRFGLARLGVHATDHERADQAVGWLDRAAADG